MVITDARGLPSHSSGSNCQPEGVTETPVRGVHNEHCNQTIKKTQVRLNYNLIFDQEVIKKGFAAGIFPRSKTKTLHLYWVLVWLIAI